jgi:hypothetical protein
MACCGVESRQLRCGDNRNPSGDEEADSASASLRTTRRLGLGQRQAHERQRCQLFKTQLLTVFTELSIAYLLLQLKNLPGHGDLAANCRALAYRLYNHCEKSKQAEEARSYDGDRLAGAGAAGKGRCCTGSTHPLLSSRIGSHLTPMHNLHH